MPRITLAAQISLIMFVLMLRPAHADYVYNARSATGWTFVDSHTIILMMGGRPLALVKMNLCLINNSSKVIVLTDELGPLSGKILVDDSVCDVIAVTRL